MTWFRTVLALCLAGVLSPAMVQGEDNESIGASNQKLRPVKKVQLNPLQQKQVVSRIITMIEDTIKTGNGSGAGSPGKGKGKIPFPRPHHKIVRHTQLGVAKIVSFGDGVICSGTHFKPWILLTTGDCLNGRDPNFLYVLITKRDNSKGIYLSVPVEVESFSIHPRYEYGNREYNLALLQVYGKFDWDVEEFLPPRADLTTANLIEKGIVTFVKEWSPPLGENSTLVSMNQGATADFVACGESREYKHWFCVLKKTGGRDTYASIDIGTPFYYKSRNMKHCLGIYTGEHINERMTGHLFHSFYESVDWIDEYIKDRPVPPIDF